MDTVHDEIVAPNPFAHAILFFRAEAGGEEKPLRVIQGPKTLMGGSMDTDNVEVNPIHNEVYVTQRTSNSVLVFDRRANGDVAPIRIIHGPQTQLRYPRRVTVDPVNNLLAVVGGEEILIFNRTDNGDVAPRYIIAGPKTGLQREGEESREMGLSKALLNPDGKKIIFGGGGRRVVEGKEKRSSFFAIWKYGDSGDVPPLYRLDGEGGGSFDLMPENQEIVIASDGVLKIFHMPEAY